MGSSSNHPNVSGDDKIKALAKAKKLPPNVDPKVKFKDHVAVNQFEIEGAYDKLVPPAEKVSAEDSAEIDEKNAEVKAKMNGERVEAHKKDPSVKLEDEDEGHAEDEDEDEDEGHAEDEDEDEGHAEDEDEDEGHNE